MYLPQCQATRIDGDQAPVWHHHPWIEFNRQLDRSATALPNEAVIDGWLEDLATLDVDDRRLYWLTVARITELTLKQAGDYADGGEFRAAGDLLVNPRAVDVYVRGWDAPIVKNRYMALSQQFADVIGDRDPVAWLASETLTHIRQPALLPHLKALLQSSGFIAKAYLSDLENRMTRVVDTMAWLAAWQVTDSSVLLCRIQSASPADRKLFAERCCRFDLDVYDAMGEEIERIVMDGRGGSRFLIPLKNASRK